MKSSTRMWSAAVASALVAGCGITTTSHVITGTAGAPVDGPVAVFMENAPLPAGFREISLVQATGNGRHADLEHVIEGLRSAARALGCTTVVRIHVDQGATVASANGVCGVVE